MHAIHVDATRTKFESLTDIRLREAKLLLDHKEWDGAYYLAGYAVEFALKVRIIAQLMASDGFPERKSVENFYKHDLNLLRDLAELKTEMDGDDAIKVQWDIVKDWSEQDRYKVGKTERQATDLYEAIDSGVLPWIKARW